jgi:hypothetical protein
MTMENRQDGFNKVVEGAVDSVKNNARPFRGSSLLAALANAIMP